MTRNILSTSLKNAYFNINFQIFCRGLTFLLNAFVIRHVGEKVLGVINVRLLLLESMILLLCREPFLKACLTDSAEHNWAQVVNMFWIMMPIWSTISILSGCTWLYALTTAEELPLYYNFAVLAITFSSIIYFLSLITQLVLSSFLFVRCKIVIETITIVLRTLIFIPMVLHRPENALWAFGVAQIVATVFYTVTHYIYIHWYIKNNIKHDKDNHQLMSSQDKAEIKNNSKYRNEDFPFKSITEFLPGQLENKDSMLDKNLVILTWSFFKQGFAMQCLTEGEKIIMTVWPLLSFAEQGTYDIVNNLGSLAARFIFRPVEDSAYFYFTQTIKRDKPLIEQNPVKVRESVDVLMHLSSFVTSIGLVILVFGQSYSSTLLWLYGGAKLTHHLPILLMRAHSFSILLLAINGITECYTNATGDKDTINRYYTYIFQSIAYFIASYTLTRCFGPVGLIFGNCVNMIVRIFYSVSFINQRHAPLKYQPLRRLMPKLFFCGSLIISAIVTSISHTYLFPEYKLYHLFIGVVMFSIVLSSWIYEYMDLIQLGVDKWRHKNSQEQTKLD
ncbi:protein RFT1 homolog [Microplitis mediator]|uniref:protein RFT1 homolog n=1 Tax=Microplitis mediator TaxID=375433 RepID=UPI002552C7C5|nr:protein RFT1 homolog [Microplitis mediator]XP_057321067.1 protein RFT1 homolog [Microplitis mediator]XP_057321068.1 protein RFT1 homolog [Microplitis mediator]